ncbi:MAG: hypothetical protein JRJ24_04990 [Deltaproteobacteria bacterium]|nr:hypothetical protein [Deltaproteobacteria bacterium]
MIAYDFVSAAPQSLDELQTEIIVLPFFSDERPLCGATGLIDWRLSGALSRKLMAGYLDGHFGEKALVTAPPKLKSEGLLLVGLGASTAFDTGVAQRACSVIAEALTEAKVSTVALTLPGRSMGLLPALDSMQPKRWPARGDQHHRTRGRASRPRLALRWPAATIRVAARLVCGSFSLWSAFVLVAPLRGT